MGSPESPLQAMEQIENQQAGRRVSLSDEEDLDDEDSVPYLVDRLDSSDSDSDDDEEEMEQPKARQNDYNMCKPKQRCNFP